MRQSHIAVIGAPMDLGAGRRGVDMGPSALRVAGLNQKLADLGYQAEYLGNFVVDPPESLPVGPTHARYLPQIPHTCARLADMVERAADKEQVPLVLGGDHSAAIGTVAGMSRHLGKTGRKLGVLWIDAHADMNTPDSSPSGNVHGMPLACIIGLGPAELTGIACHVPMVEPQNVAIVGLRSVDDIERFNVRGAGVHYREAHLAMEIVNDSGLMTSLEMVELNPVMDVANQTAILGVELIMSALGKRIL
jgi:arginase